jgi:formylglycine-generating enzyme required for sulfatase activity
MPYAAVLLIIGLWSLSPVSAGEFQDCDACPVMVSIPAGTFLMGTATENRLIDPRTGKPAKNDGPQHAVTFKVPFALGKYEVTVKEFGAFVEDTGHETTNRCMEFSKENSFTFNENLNWNDVGFEQSGSHPVVCVSFFDALAYAEWLSDQTGEKYRLPTEAEWEYAARAGSTGPYFWGNDRAATCDYANVRSQGAYTISKRQAQADREKGFPCDDGFTQSSGAGNFLPNEFGLYDVQGNAWEWTVDCIHKDYKEAPIDGSAWIDDQDCQFAVIRSGSYLNLVERSSTTVRAGRPKNGGATNMGFRIARGQLAGSDTDSAALLSNFDPSPSGIDDSAGAKLFEENCAACHTKRTTYQGIYGKDQKALEDAIKNGGNNVMSMPAFADRLSDA